MIVLLNKQCISLQRFKFLGDGVSFSKELSPGVAAFIDPASQHDSPLSISASKWATKQPQSFFRMKASPSTLCVSVNDDRCKYNSSWLKKKYLFIVMTKLQCQLIATANHLQVTALGFHSNLTNYNFLRAVVHQLKLLQRSTEQFLLINHLQTPFLLNYISKCAILPHKSWSNYLIQSCLSEVL